MNKIREEVGDFTRQYDPRLLHLRMEDKNIAFPVEVANYFIFHSQGVTGEDAEKIEKSLGRILNVVRKIYHIDSKINPGGEFTWVRNRIAASIESTKDPNKVEVVAAIAATAHVLRLICPSEVGKEIAEDAMYYYPIHYHLTARQMVDALQKAADKLEQNWDEITAQKVHPFSAFPRNNYLQEKILETIRDTVREVAEAKDFGDHLRVRDIQSGL